MLQDVCARVKGVLLSLLDYAQYVCVRTIGVLLLFIDNAAGCLCQNDRCVVIVPRLCCSMFVSER